MCELLLVVVTHDETSGLFLDGSGRREALFSADSAKDRSVANARRLAIFLQPFGHLAANQRIGQMLGRPRCAPQFNRSLPCPLAIWLLARS